MKDHIVIKLDSTTELLQYFTGSVTVTQSTKKYAATSIQAGLAVGDKIYIAGCGQTASNGLKTIATLGTNELTVEEAVGTDEGPTASVTLNQEYQGDWKEVDQFSHLLPTINCSGNAYIYVDFSGDGVNTDYTNTGTITGGTADMGSIETGLPFARLRVRNNGADQTTMRAYLYGRRLT